MTGLRARCTVTRIPRSQDFLICHELCTKLSRFSRSRLWRLHISRFTLQVDERSKTERSVCATVWRGLQALPHAVGKERFFFLLNTHPLSQTSLARAFGTRVFPALTASRTTPKQASTTASIFGILKIMCLLAKRNCFDQYARISAIPLTLRLLRSRTSLSILEWRAQKHAFVYVSVQRIPNDGLVHWNKRFVVQTERTVPRYLAGVLPAHAMFLVLLYNKPPSFS